jgi:hypothetical protein
MFSTDYIIEEVKATQSMEGIVISKEIEDIYRRYLDGILSEKEALKILKSKARN